MTVETETPAREAPLHLIFLIDASGSMWRDDLIRHVNFALRKGLPELRLVARDHPSLELLVRVARFGDGAEWHVDVPASLNALEWSDIWANGGTDMGAGLRLVARDLRPGAFPADAPPPVLVLLSDGFPTDDFAGGLRALLSQPWGRRSRRFAIAIGPDADRESLAEFVDGSEEHLLIAETAAEVADQIRELFTERLPPLLEAPSGGGEEAAVSAPPAGLRWRAAGSGLPQGQGPVVPAGKHQGRKAVRWVTQRGMGIPLALAGAVGSVDPCCFRSLIGAQIAAQVGSAWLLEALTPRRAKTPDRKQPLGLSAQALTVALVEQWRRLVLSHFHSFPFTDEEMEAVVAEGASTLVYELNPAAAYGATFAAVVLTESHIVSLRLGEGGILSMTQDGDVFQPFLGSETSEEIVTLSDMDAAKHIQTVVQDAGEMMPTLLLCYPEGAPPGDAAEELSGRLLEVLESHRVGKVTAVDTWLLEAARINEGEESAVGIAYNVAPFE